MNYEQLMSNKDEVLSHPTNQEQKVFGHLVLFKKITPGEAMAQYGIHRLAARILNLRQAGVFIKTERVTRGDRRFAQYVLVRK